MELPALPRMYSILLWGNDITDCVWPPAHFRFEALRVLDLGSNRLKEVPRGLSKACPALTDLNLSCNDISELSAELTACTTLRLLKVRGAVLFMPFLAGTLRSYQLCLSCRQMFGASVCTEEETGCKEAGTRQPLYPTHTYS